MMAIKKKKKNMMAIKKEKKRKELEHVTSWMG